MSGRTPDWMARPFGSAELEGVAGLGAEDLAADAFVARELEALAGAAGGGPSGDFVDRVMAAVTVEPAPAPARLARQALRRGALGALLASLADAWRVATGPGFPRAVRAQALALVLLAAGLAAGSGVAMAGALGLLQNERHGPAPVPSLEAPSLPAVAPLVAPSSPPTPSPTPDATAPSATPVSATPSESTVSTGAGAPEPTQSPSPRKTQAPTATDDHRGGTGHQATPAPERTPRPTPTDDDDHSGPGGGGGGDGDSSPEPDDTATPDATDSSGSGSSGSGSSGSGSGSGSD